MRDASQIYERTQECGDFIYVRFPLELLHGCLGTERVAQRGEQGTQRRFAPRNMTVK